MRLFVGGANGLHLYEDGELSQLAEQPVLCMARLSGGRLVAASEHGSVVIWDGNEAWVAAKDLGDGVHALGVAADGAVFAGTIPAGAWVSKDRGESWTELPAFSRSPGSDDWNAPWGSPVATAIANHPKDAGTVYIGVEVGGVYRSRDAGKKWFDLGIPQTDVHSIQLAPARPDRVYASTGQGCFCSDDGGYNWRQLAVADPRRYTMGLALHPSEVDRVIVSAAAGPPPSWKGSSGARCDIYLSTDGGRRFRTVVKDLKGAVQRKALVINPKVPSEVAFAASTGELWYSNDGGESFDKEVEKLGNVKAIAFA
jgi:photosystem II stability/assembly factor-like uncharacterized protein